MTRTSRVLFASFLIGAVAAGHHSLAAEYDTSKAITLHGKITKVSWMNPHVYIWMDSADAAGKVANWEIESAAPNYLQSLGWAKPSLKPGDTVTVHAYAAKDQSNLAKMDAITFPDGRQMTIGHADDRR
jgi:hypothetical protein